MAEVSSVSLSEISEPSCGSVLGVLREEKSSACREFPELESRISLLLLCHNMGGNYPCAEVHFPG